MEQKKDRRIWLVVCALLLLIVGIAAAALAVGTERRRNAGDTYGTMQDEVNAVSGKDEKEENGLTADAEEADRLAQLGIEIPEKNLDWDALRQENPDIYAWIYVPDTDVDYPVLQHPTDNSYYLNYNIDGTKGYPGCIYSEDYNAKDFSDVHTVLYGHNLKDGTMFTSLHNFEDKDLFGRDHYIFIYTESGALVYQIFAAYEFDSRHLLDNFDFTNEYVYADYLKAVYETDGRVANVRQDIEVTVEDRILTLSTCTADHDSSRRFLVTGVLLNPSFSG